MKRIILITLCLFTLSIFCGCSDEFENADVVATVALATEPAEMSEQTVVEEAVESVAISEASVVEVSETAEETVEGENENATYAIAGWHVLWWRSRKKATSSVLTGAWIMPWRPLIS